MIQRIRTGRFATFASCALLMACAQAPDPAQLTAVDQLIQATDAALLTLNELDRSRYVRGDSLFRLQRDGFASIFKDTLPRDQATLLADQFIALRASAQMKADHERVLSNIGTSSERLRTLRNDIATGHFRKEEAAPLVAMEQRLHTELITEVHAVIDNYRTLQLVWDRNDRVSGLLSTNALSMTP